MPTSKTDLDKLTKLGKKAKPERSLEIFPNHAFAPLLTSLIMRILS